MPPLQGSRHRQANILTDARGVRHLSSRDLLRYRDRDDNRTHEVVQGDTLWALASHYFRGVPNAASLWWAIGDYQRPPITDPTRALPPGAILDVPSVALVREHIEQTR